MAFCGRDIECWIGSFVIFQGIWTNIANKPYIFVIFQGVGGSGSPVHHSGSAHVSVKKTEKSNEINETKSNFDHEVLNTIVQKSNVENPNLW